MPSRRASVWALFNELCCSSRYTRLTLETVFIFTAALFLSGYAIQQRTVRDLRQAIRPTPKPSPKTYLPDQFKKIITELPDGNIVPVRQQDERVVIEIKPTPPKQVQEISETNEESIQKPIPALNQVPESAPEKKTKNKKTSSARAQKYREQQLKKKKQLKEQEGLLVQQGQQQQQDYSPQTSDEADRQGLIEIPEGMLEHPDPDKRAEKAVSPAERRRLIKEEIKRLAQPEERGYYQRRLW